MVSVRDLLIIGAVPVLAKARARQQGTSWGEWTPVCPPQATTSLSFTQYDTVTYTAIESVTTSIFETQIQPTTIFQTIIQTQLVTVTAPTTDYLTQTATDIEITSTTLIQPTTEIQIDTVSTTEDFYFTNTTTDLETIFLTQTVTTPVTATVTTPTTATVTTPTTQTQTQTVTTPTTVTASESLELITYTSQVTSLTICPTRVVNPTFTIQEPLPTDWTWGCPPGWICKPDQIDCNFEAGIPDRNFYCSPNECILAGALPNPLQTWDNDTSGDASPATDPSLKFNAIDTYFNMDPNQFGFGYDVFVVNEVFTITSTIIEAPQPTMKPRQFQQTIPGACYPWCNDCLLEAQSVGKTPALCKSGSAYEVDLQNCIRCIGQHAADTASAGGFVNIAPQFQQYMDFCSQTTVEVSTSMTITTTSGQATMTSVVPVSSLTLVSEVSTTPTPQTSTVVPTSPTASASPSTSPTGSNVFSSSEFTVVVPTTNVFSSSEFTVITPTTTVSPASETTLSGTQLSSITVILPTGGSQTTLSGTQLSGITIVLPVSTSAGTGGSPTPAATGGSPSVSIGGASQTGSSTTSGPVATYSGNTAPNLRAKSDPTLITFFAALIALL